MARLKEIEAEVCKNAFHTLVVSHNMKRYLQSEHEGGADKITIIQNGADLQQNRATYRLPMKIVFGGCFNYWEDMDAYLDMAGSDKEGEYYLIGGGPLQDHVTKRIKQEKIEIDCLGSKDGKKALDLFCNMSVGIAPSTKNLTRYVASPVKVYDYMACGLPVITPRCGEWADQVEEDGCGFVTQNSSGAEFLEALCKIHEKKVWEEKASNCREAIKTKYNWGRVLAPIQRIMEA